VPDYFKSNWISYEYWHMSTFIWDLRSYKKSNSQILAPKIIQSKFVVDFSYQILLLIKYFQVGWVRFWLLGFLLLFKKKYYLITGVVKSFWKKLLWNRYCYLQIFVQDQVNMIMGYFDYNLKTDHVELLTINQKQARC